MTPATSELRRNSVATMPGRNGGTLRRGNPDNAGRPPKKYLTNALEKLVQRRVPSTATGILQPLRGKLWADVMAAGLAEAAAEGDASAFREAADRLEGKVPQAVTGAGGAPLIPEHPSLADEAARLLAAIAGRAK